MIQLIEDPTVNLDLMSQGHREPGLSGFIRAKNEGEYIYQAIETWLHLVDEIIVVFNDCTDNTEAEIERAIATFGNRIKAFKYLPAVYPQGSKEHIALPPDSPNSLVNYYNFALSRTTRSLVVKIDGDLIFDYKNAGKIKNRINKLGKTQFLKLHGVNLIDDKGQLFVPSNSMFCGLHGDLCVFPVSKEHIFKWRPEYEYLNREGLEDAGGMFAYYHTKFIKNDMGLGNYLLKENPESRYTKISKGFIIDLKFLEVSDVLNDYHIEFSHPDDLSIKPSSTRNLTETYIKALNKQDIYINQKDIALFRISKIKNILKNQVKKVISPIRRSMP